MRVRTRIQRRLEAWYRRVRSAWRLLRRGPGPPIAVLRELRRAGCLRVATPASGEALVVSLVFADGDLLTKTTAAGTERWDDHRAALEERLADLRATPEALGALVPLVLLPGALLCVADLVRAANVEAIARDLVVLALPWALLALGRALLTWWFRRRIAALAD